MAFSWLGHAISENLSIHFYEPILATKKCQKSNGKLQYNTDLNHTMKDHKHDFDKNTCYALNVCIPPKYI